MDDFELPDQGDKIIRAPDVDYEPNEGGIGLEFFLNMKRFKHKTAQICSASGHRDTYGMLLKRCVRTAIHMRSHGVTSEDIVALCSYNHIDSCVPYIATLFLGAKIAALDPTIPLDDTKHLISQISPKMAFIVPECLEMYEEVFADLSLKCEIVVFDTTDGLQNSFSEFLKPTVDENDFIPEKVNLMFIAPIQAMSMIKCGRPEGLNTTSLYDVIIGGGPMSSENILTFRDLLPGTNCSLVYGQTEVAGMVTMFKPCVRKDVMLLVDKPSSSGRAIAGMWYKICDLETDVILGPNTTGELRVKSKLQLNGYHNISSEGIWDKDGWLRTGDICYYDEDHCFYIVDRIKELMKYQSWHVAPALLEGILQEHPAVQIAVVFGVPHEIDGDHPIAIVVRSQAAGDVTEKELEEFVNGRVGERQKLRAGVRFVDDVPHTPSGKIKRKYLKETILKQLELGM